MEKLKRYDRGDTDSDIALDDRAPGVLKDEDDPQSKRIEKLQRDVNEEYSKRPKVTVKALKMRE